MTSKLTRERIELIANFHSAMTLPPSHAEIEELARMALAAMDSEPVAYISKSDFNAGYPHILARRDFNKACTMAVYAAQPAPVVLDDGKLRELFDAWFASDCSFDLSPEASEADNIAWRESYWYVWKRCRAAMLQELQKSAGAEATCRSNENVQVLHTKSPAQSDCCPAQNHVSPEQSGDTPAQSQGWIPLSEQMPPGRHEVLVGRWWGEKPRWCCKWATYIPGHPDAQSSGWLIPGASWTPTHWMPLPAAPQEVK